ncbi:hypothetical protein KUTeg_015734 [Tegillarca granosa]|uniref:Uncharacterized protein n=1 Tax=Tegillarca granosa TaxID=220873 RepID=A0ABQ9EN61_TEGGR|nr:hypothetical protein KUTeg_015734 [Tegillarca granosa]
MSGEFLVPIVFFCVILPYSKSVTSQDIWNEKYGTLREKERTSCTNYLAVKTKYENLQRNLNALKTECNGEYYGKYQQKYKIIE